MVSPFFERDDQRTYVPTASAAGPWSSDLLHAGPPSALLARTIIDSDAESSLRLTSVTVDILAPLTAKPLRVDIKVIRPGRNVRLVEARGTIDDKPVISLRGWLMSAAPSSVPTADRAPRLAVPAEESESYIPGAHNAGYLAAVEWRFAEGTFTSPGPAAVWARPRVALVDDEPMSGWDRTLVLADSGSGVSLLAPPGRIATINCDLRVCLHREPQTPWVLMESETRMAPGQMGAASTSLSDEIGAVGTASQALLVTAMS